MATKKPSWGKKNPPKSLAERILARLGSLVLVSAILFAILLEINQVWPYIRLMWTSTPANDLTNRVGTYIFWVFPVACIGWLVGFVIVMGLAGLFTKKSRILEFLVGLAYALFMSAIGYFDSSWYWLPRLGRLINHFIG